MAVLGNGADRGGRRTSSPAGQTGRTELWVRAHHADVYRYLYRLCGSPNDADDLTQQTFLAAHVNGHQLRNVSRLKPWLLAIARSKFLKWVAKRGPANATDAALELEECGASEPSPSRAEDGQGDNERLQMALAQLPHQWRVMLTMYYYDQATYKEIAAELGLPMGTVMSRLARAKEKLRRLYFGSPDVATHLPVVTKTRTDDQR